MGDAELDSHRDDLLAAVGSALETGDATEFGQPAEAAIRESWFDVDWPADAEWVAGYWLREPFAHAAILRDPESEALTYHLTEPALDDFEAYVRQDLADRVRTRLLDDGVDTDGQDPAEFEQRLHAAVADAGRAVPPATLHKLGYYFRRDFLRYGAIDPFMADPAVEDVSCDGAGVPVFVYHADYGNVETTLEFTGAELDSLVEKLAQRAGRHVSASQPLLTTTLPDGSRLQVTLGTDVATRGSNLTLRKFREEPFTPTELIDLGTYSVEQMAYIWLLIEQNRSVLFVGPTATGKTTTMNATSLFIPPDAKVVSIEETREVTLPHDNWIANVTRESDLGEERPEVDTAHLLDEALHQRPTHIVVGEIRTDPSVVFTFFQAIGTGHAGFTTFHAESARDVLRRLMHEPLSIASELVTDLDAIAVQHLVSTGQEEVRKAWSIQEVRTAESDDGVRPRLNEVFAYDPDTAEHDQVGDSELLRDIAVDRGWSDEDLREQLRQRRRVLAHMVAEGITGFEETTAFLFGFSRDPERVLRRIDEVHGTARIDVAEFPPDRVRGRAGDAEPESQGSEADSRSGGG